MEKFIQTVIFVSVFLATGLLGKSTLAETGGSFQIPDKQVKFIRKSDQKPWPVDAYFLQYVYTWSCDPPESSNCPAVYQNNRFTFKLPASDTIKVETFSIQKMKAPSKDLWVWFDIASKTGIPILGSTKRMLLADFIAAKEPLVIEVEPKSVINSPTTLPSNASVSDKKIVCTGKNFVFANLKNSSALEVSPVQSVGGQLTFINKAPNIWSIEGIGGSRVPLELISEGVEGTGLFSKTMRTIYFFNQKMSYATVNSFGFDSSDTYNQQINSMDCKIER